MIHRRTTVYGLASPRDGKIRYVGQTTKPLERRLIEHKSMAQRFPNRHLSKWLHRLAKDGFEPIIFPIEQDAVLHATERRLIKWYRLNGVRLVNATEGGEGVLGLHLSDSAKAKLRAANLGKKQSKATREKRAATLKGRKRPRVVCTKILATKQGRRCPWVSERNKDEKFRRKVAAGVRRSWQMRSRHCPDDVRAKISVSLRRHHASKRGAHGLES